MATSLVLLTRIELAKIFGVSKSFLDHAAQRGSGPPFVRLGRAVRYDVRAVSAWLVDQSVSTGAA